MTCIVGIEENGKTYIGGDGYLGYGELYSISLYPKVFWVGDAIIGWSGDSRAGQLLKAKLHIPEQVDMEDDDFMSGPFVDALRECFSQGGYSVTENGYETIDSTFLVAYNDKLWLFGMDFGWVRPLNGICTLGSGAEVAMGAVLALKDYSPRERIMRTLEIVSQVSPYVKAPYSVLPGAENGSLSY